jgi:hypothetical protein
VSGPKLVSLPASLDKASTLEVLDRLRASVEAGEVAAFWAVTIAHDDSTSAWCGQTTPVSRLRGMGAVAHLQACMHAGEV